LDILTQGARWTYRLKAGRYSTADKNVMLDDIVLNIEGLHDDAVHGTLSSKHVDYNSFLTNIIFSARKTLFATEQGFVGQARHDPRQSFCGPGPFPGHSAHKDDVVVVPRGANTPWLLRETDVKGEYKLVIDCCVPDIVSRELMSLLESGKLQTQRFTLV
jgi:hypothetical protein